MFVFYGDRRINLSLVRQYKPLKNENDFQIELLFLDGTKEELHFFDKEKERDDFLKKLDQHVKE